MPTNNYQEVKLDIYRIPAKAKATMHIKRKPEEMMEVDWAGKTDKERVGTMVDIEPV